MDWGRIIIEYGASWLIGFGTLLTGYGAIIEVPKRIRINKINEISNEDTKRETREIVSLLSSLLSDVGNIFANRVTEHTSIKNGTYSKESKNHTFDHIEIFNRNLSKLKHLYTLDYGVDNKYLKKDLYRIIEELSNFKEERDKNPFEKNKEKIKDTLKNLDNMMLDYRNKAFYLIN